MPRPRTPQSYPSIFGEMIDTVASRGEDFRHLCPDNKAAQHLRFVFYDYIKACKKSQIPQDIQRADMAAGLMFTIEENYLVIKSRDTTNEALALQKSLDQYMGKPFKAAANSKQPKPPSFIPDAPAPSAGPSQEDLISSFMKDKKK